MITKTYEIEASVDAVWKALTDQETVMQWTGQDGEMSPNEDFDFNLWDGDIWGRNVRMIPNQLIEQSWYGGDWPKPSHVVIKLEENRGVTTVQLEHSGVPEAVEADFDAGWDSEYFGPIKELLEKQ